MGWPHGRSVDGGIDEIPLPGIGPGRLWLCGKHAIGPDPEGLLARVDATGAVCLNEAHELEDRYPDYVAWLAEHAGDRAVHHPVPDLHAPPVEQLAALVEALVTRLGAGERLIVHCGAGIGRAGTLAVAIAMRTGVALADALALIGDHRPMAGPEAGAQTEVLQAYAQLLAAEGR